MENVFDLGFKGNINWIYNEEGSGAKMYHSSVYYPDSLVNPQTNSGITIDPGLDLGNCEEDLAHEVLDNYNFKGFLKHELHTLLVTSFGLKRLKAVEWIKTNKQYFKNSFLVPEDEACRVMGSLTAPNYWESLIYKIPELLKIENSNIQKAVHTALLDMAYNRGFRRTIELSDSYVKNGDWMGLAGAIKAVKSSTDSLKARRLRESLLILAALKLGDKMEIQIDYTLNPIPLTVISHDERELMIDPEKLEILPDLNIQVPETNN